MALVTSGTPIRATLHGRSPGLAAKECAMRGTLVGMVTWTMLAAIGQPQDVVESRPVMLLPPTPAGPEVASHPAPLGPPELVCPAELGCPVDCAPSGIPARLTF